MTRAAETTTERLIRLMHERARRTVEALARRERRYASFPTAIDVTPRTTPSEQEPSDG